MEFSISELIRQNTVGQSEGFPIGVPLSYSWYKGWNAQGQTIPPADFSAVQGWGQIYQEEGAATKNSNPDAIVEVANANTYVHVKQASKWVLVQDQSKMPLTGGHFVPDFAGNEAIPMKVTHLPGGHAALDVPPAGYNNHFWYQSRGTYAAGSVDAVYVQMDIRLSDSDLKLVAMVGVDWWRDSSAPFLDDHSNNPAVGVTNWVELSTEWKRLGYYSMSTERFQEDLPPPLIDTAAPTTPKISSFAPGTGIAGDKVTSARLLTLNGTAEVGSTVKIFDGSTQIGTAIADANGAWSFTTTELSNAVHGFTAAVTDDAGKTSASPLLNVKVDAATGTSAPTPALSSEKPMVKGSLDKSLTVKSEWVGFSRTDEFYNTAQAAGTRGYNIYVDADSRVEPTGSTTIEGAWPDSFILLPLIFGTILKIRRNGPQTRPQKQFEFSNGNISGSGSES